MSRFRKLMVAVFGSGALAGLVLFAVQHFTVVPLIQAAETYEADRILGDPEPPSEE